MNSTTLAADKTDLNVPCKRSKQWKRASRNACLEASKRLEDKAIGSYYL